VESRKDKPNKLKLAEKAMAFSTHAGT
jgi:hypothetical protein